jgi:hypothetical protein
MAKPPYYRIFLIEGSSHYLVARLWQQKSDESLMLQMQPSKQSSGGMIGKVEITGDTFDIHYDQIDTPAEIDHTTIHATGQSHTKLKDGSRSTNYDKDHAGIPLKDLKTIKHLGTLLSREMTQDDELTPERATDVLIERGAGQKFSVLDILAIPKGANINFSADWDMENERQVVMTIGMHRLGFNGFDVLVFTRSSDQFDNVPNKTLHLPDMNNIVPFVVKLDDKKATIKLSALTFDEIVSLQDKANPYDGFTVITATPKFL